MKKKIIVSIMLAICVLAVPAQAATPVSDVASNHWAYPYVSYLTDRDIMPLDDGCFYPDVFTTRGEFVLYLWRATGSPDYSPAVPAFKDVGVYDEYYSAVEWAAYYGITTGTSADMFSPELCLTREQAFTFLWRSLPLFGYDTEGLTGRYINGFADAEHVSQWSWQAMNELCALGIVNGSNGYLMPQRDVLNAETAALLYRTLELVDALYDLIDFDIYNESEYTISAIYVMPSYTDGEGVDILQMPLNPYGSLNIQLTENFVYSDDLEWMIYIVDSDGDTSYSYQIFYPRDLEYLEICWDYWEGGYYCEFIY